MKVGIVGVGSMGTTHAVGWAETPAEIVGFTAETQQEAGNISKQYDTKVYPSLEEMLPDVDVVDVCSPTHLHYEMALKAAAAGKHIICEKPLARTLAEASNIGEAVIAFDLPFRDDYERAKSKSKYCSMSTRSGMISRSLSDVRPTRIIR